MARSIESLRQKIKRLQDNTIGTKEDRERMRKALAELDALPPGSLQDREFCKKFDRLNKAANDAIAKVPFWGQW